MTDPRPRDLIRSVSEDGRSLLPSESVGDTYPGLADDAAVAARHVARLVNAHVYVTAPDLYRVLPDLSATCHRLGEALPNLGAALARSLDVPELAVFDDKAEPHETVAAARSALERASRLLAEAGRMLDNAQSAINSQSYVRDDAPEHG